MKDFDLKKYLAEGKLYENEEQGYTLYTTNVEYDNGKTGYMYQLVNSEDGEENEIGFDQLYFDDKDNHLEMGRDFKDFDQGSFQEEEVSAEEAMKIYKSLAEGKLNENEPTVFDDESMDALLDIIMKYVKDPDDAQYELDRFDNGGFDAMSDMVTANLLRDPEYKAWYDKLHNIK